MEYIYILKEREFIKTNEDIYKIGKTRQDNLGRFNNYPNGSSLYLQYFCNNSDFIELRIIDSFKENFIQRLDIGREYFEGNIDEMMDKIYHIRNQYSNLSKEEIDSIETNRINNMKNEALKKKVLREEIRLKNQIMVENLKKTINEHKKKEEEIINKHYLVKRVKNTKKINEEICGFFLKWFKENYRFTKEKKKYVSFNTLYHEFIVTKYYINLNNNQKKIYCKEYFFNFCKKNENFYKYFRERYNNIRSIFTNYEKYSNVDEIKNDFVLNNQTDDYNTEIQSYNTDENHTNELIDDCISDTEEIYDNYSDSSDYIDETYSVISDSYNRKDLLEENVIPDKSNETEKNDNTIYNLSIKVDCEMDIDGRLSCSILPWFKENYEKTSDKEFIKVKDIYENFSTSNYFNNLSKPEKRRYNKTFFNEYFETNIFLRGFYAERYNNIRSVIRGWKIKNQEDE